jgi:hypothetical protein
MMTSKLLAMCILALMLGFSPVANATLINNGGGLIYDTDRDITWYDAPVELRSWDNSMTWAANLTVGNTTAGTWRLPTALNQDGTGPVLGYVTDSEMGHLYYVELGNVSGNGGFVYKGPFTNLPSSPYWSGTGTPGSGCAWNFRFYDGLQDYSYGSYLPYYALAVHAGNVPEPATMSLLCLGALSLIRRKK